MAASPAQASRSGAAPRRSPDAAGPRPGATGSRPPAAARPAPTGGRSDAGARFGARALLALVAVGLAAVPFGVLLVLVRVRWEPLIGTDAGVARELHALALDSQGFVAVMKALSTIGSAAAYVPFFAVLAAVLAWRGLPRLALFAIVTVLGSSALNGLVKAAVDRARPAFEDPVATASGLSFPSGHAQSAIVTYSVLLIVLAPMLGGRGRRVAATAAAVMVVGIGFSRVVLGVHYVSDVLGGYVLGAAWVAAMTAAFSAWRRERGPGADPYGSAAGPVDRPAARRAAHLEAVRR